MEVNDLNRGELLKKWQPTIDKTFDIFSWTSGHELAALCEFASRANGIVEIGGYHGKSAKCMSLANPEAKILVIDLPQDIRCQRILEINLTNTGAYIFSGNSRESYPALSEHAQRAEIKFGFVDGGHLEADVAYDISMLLTVMKPGSILSGHDWRSNNMDDGVNRGVLSHFPRERINIFESIWWVKL